MILIMVRPRRITAGVFESEICALKTTYLFENNEIIKRITHEFESLTLGYLFITLEYPECAQSIKATW